MLGHIAFPAGGLIELGAFDERFRTAEDRELCRRWAQAGYALGRVSDAIVEHDDRLTLGRFFRKFMAYGRGAAKFHATGRSPSLRESLAFHLRLPALVVPELRRRKMSRRVAIVALLLLWEVANLWGFIAEQSFLALQGRATADTRENPKSP